MNGRTVARTRGRTEARTHGRTAARTHGGTGARRHGGARVATLALLLCVGASVRPCVALAQCPDGTPPPCGHAVARSAAPAPTSVAVLYFDNLSRDTSDTYLADGLTDELITRLGQVERLQVKSRNAVRRFRGSAAEDPAAVGRALGVAHLVSGSVRRTGDRVRVTVELTRAATGAHVWGDTYDRTDHDLMAVESEVARAVATAVSGRLAPADQRALSARPTTNPGAYDRALRGDYLLARRNGPDARAALDEYEAAVRLDPGFARAWARVGLAYCLFMDWGWPYPGLSQGSILVRGVAAADRAIAADSQGAEGWMARGKLAVYRDPARLTGAVSALERAVQLDPRNAEAWHQLGGVLALLRRDDDAIRAQQRALALDPQRMITLENEARALLYLERPRDALPLLDSAVAVAPDAYYPHQARGLVRLALGDRAGASADADAAVHLGAPPNYVEPLLVALAASAGDTAGALARGRRFAEAVGDGPTPVLISVALAFALTGDVERTLPLLERARPGGISTWYWMQNPSFAAVRQDPRFQRLLAELAPPGPR